MNKSARDVRDNHAGDEFHRGKRPRKRREGKRGQAH
jgi:hypothetical protein